MAGHEISDGTYTATVATCTGDLVTFIAPSCEPTILIAPGETLPQAEFTPGDSIKITTATNDIVDLNHAPE